MRVNMSILGMCIVDTWMLYKGINEGSNYVKQTIFYSVPSQPLTNNSYEYRGRRERQWVAEESVAFSNGKPTSGIDAHLRPKKERKTPKGKKTKFAVQDRCVLCKYNLTSFVCSQYRDDDLEEK